MGCPLIVYTDLDTSLCKTIEESQLTRVEHLSRTLGPAVGWHPPHGMHDLEGPEHQLDDLERAVLLPPLLGHRGDPTPCRVVDTGIGHQQLVGLFDPQRLIIDQDHDGLPPEELIRIEAEVVQSNLTMLAYLAPELAKPEDAPETACFYESPRGIGQDDFRRHVVDSPVGVLTCVRPMTPELIVLHELGMLPIHRLPISTSRHICVHHPTLDREASLSEVLPRMSLGDRSPPDRQLRETGLQRDKHRPMVADDRLRRSPLPDGLAEHLDQLGEI